MQPLRISARELGQLLLNNFCERCFWFAKNFPLAQNHPLSSPMPGIVSQVDAYAKRVVNTHWQSSGFLPPWLTNALRDSFAGLNFHSVRPINPTRWRLSLFNNRCELVGEADAIWEFADGSWFIADYKTASRTPTQQSLFPLYEAQLNAYAYLAQKLQGKTIAGLALIYFEPEHNIPNASQLLQRTSGQMMLGFQCTVVPVPLKPTNWVSRLCWRVLQILSSPSPPTGKQNCQGCQALASWWRGIKNHLP